MIGPNAAKWLSPMRPASADVGGDRNAAAAVDISARATAPAGGQTRADHSGTTHEPIDPVRYIANRSSGKQGFAIAAAAQAAGADVAAGLRPVELRDPAGVTVIRVDRRATCCTGCKPHCRPISRSRPPSPTGASP
jgi:phosphopantothenoylcysteine decarboxylase/phosphopantothenate--cysteine ligase